MKAIVAYFKVFLRHSLGRAERNSQRYRSEDVDTMGGIRTGYVLIIAVVAQSV
jgi:hypothetical protein